MDEIKYLQNFAQCIKDGQVQFTKVHTNLDGSGRVPLLYDLFFCEMGDNFICFGVNVMGVFPIPQGSFFVIGDKNQHLASFIKPATIFSPSYLTANVPEDVVVIELESLWNQMCNRSKGVAQEIQYQKCVQYNRCLMMVFEQMRVIAYDNCIEQVYH